MQVNKTINMLCSWHAQGKDSKEFQRHVDRVPDYLWLAEDGMKMQVPLSFNP
jgi:lanosterol synthase